MLSRRGLPVVAGIVLAAALALFLAGTRPGSAAFPGANGRIAYICTPEGMEICLVNPDGSALGYLTQTDLHGENFDERYPVWSPEGRRLAFVVIGFCTNEIYVMNADRTGLRRVLREQGESTGMWTIQDLSWSPDGSKLVFGKSFHEGRCPMQLPAQIKQIFTIGVDGTNQRRITDGNAFVHDIEPAWSADGTQIAFVRELNVRLDHGLYVISPDGASRRQLDLQGRGSPDWSPDGRQIAYECDGTAGREICVYTVGGGIRRLGVGSTPAWSPDGRQLVFVLQPGQSQADPSGGIYVMAADGTGRREIVGQTGYSSDGPGHPTWQPCPGPCAPAPGLPTFLKRPTPPTPLYASVGPGFTITLRSKARRPVKTLVEGRYDVRISDRSRHHSFHVVGQNGKFQPRSTVHGVSRVVQRWDLKPGTYRFFCDAHPRKMHGRFRVVADPRGSYRP
jgi:Tol biopolymer transport system component